LVLRDVPAAEQPHPPVDFRSGRLLLRDHARRLLGPAPRDRLVRIMVTMPSAAAEDVRLIEDLLRAGMDLMRINCAHDDATAWRKMAANLRRAEQVVGRNAIQVTSVVRSRAREALSRSGTHPHRQRVPRKADGRRGSLTPAREPEPVRPAPLRSSSERPQHEAAIRAIRCRPRICGRHRTLRVVEQQAGRRSPRPRGPSMRRRATPTVS
jgi:hypothetical protein